VTALSIDPSPEALKRIYDEAPGVREDVALEAVFQAGVEAERARAAAEPIEPIVLDEAAFIQRHLIESTGKSADYASAYQHDTLHGETHAEIARRAYEVASEMLAEVRS
jgi:hypothetical protein